MQIKTAWLSFIYFLFCAAALAQEPVTLSAAIVTDSESGKKSIKVQMNLEEGWHAYAKVPKGSPLPITVVEIEFPNGVTPDGELQRPEGTPDPENPAILIYEGAVTIAQTINAENDAAVEIPIVVSFQLCTDDRCLPPEDWRTTLHLPAKN